jgi:hypothetical protein
MKPDPDSKPMASRAPTVALANVCTQPYYARYTLAS